MEQREKLIELMLRASMDMFNIQTESIEIIADHLLANGVVVLPCRCAECYESEFGNVDTVWCYFHDTVMSNNGFCNYAKRKGGKQ